MFMQKKIDEINKKLLNLKNISSILIWGAGKHTCKLLEKTSLFTYDVKWIVDIDEKKQMSSFYGFCINSPENVLWDTVGAVVISVPNKEAQIKKSLLGEFNYKGIILTLYEDRERTPFYQLYDENILEVCYLGDYKTWNDALKECKGYDDSLIFNKVVDSNRKVLNGDALWERDGCLFYKPKYIYSLCASVLRCALQNMNKGVKILDIGGSLGSTYFQNRAFFHDVNNLEYIIAEQNNFYDYGYRNLEDSILKFINSKSDYSAYGKFDIVLFSASLQYIPQYKEIINKVIKLQPSYIILDRILVSDRNRICKELVPKEIYESSYPVMIYSENELVDFWSPDYKMIEKDVSNVPEKVYFVDGSAESKYYVFQRVGCI